MAVLGQRTMPIMLFNWASFGIADAIVVNFEITILQGWIYQLFKILLALLIPITLDKCYVLIRNYAYYIFRSSDQVDNRRA